VTLGAIVAGASSLYRHCIHQLSAGLLRLAGGFPFL